MKLRHVTGLRIGQRDGDGEWDEVDNNYYLYRRKCNVLSYWNNSRLVIEPLLARLAEKVLKQ
jgi:hypothetical protein